MSKMDIVEELERTSFESDSHSSNHCQVDKGKAKVQDEQELVDVDLQFAETLLKLPSLSTFSEFNVGGKRKVKRELFPSSSKKVNVPVASSLELITATPPIRKLFVLDISHTKDRFALEGKILNKYGTYDSSKTSNKYLKVNLIDEVGFGIVTLVFGSAVYQNFKDLIIIDSCVRVEGAVVRAKNPSDGGSIDYSLHADATTTLQPIPSFKTELFFLLELRIRTFLEKNVSNPSFRTTIAFVIIQVDNVQKSEGGVYEQLTIGDGLHARDCATLTFVNKRKALYYQLVEQFYRENSAPYLARNVGHWKERSNTLSVLDVTLIVPLQGEKRIRELEFAFTTQVKSLGYGKEILRITNFNDTLVVKKCSICKGQHVNIHVSGAFCFSCGKNVDVVEVVKLLGGIETKNTCLDVTLSGEAVDKVVNLQKPLLTLCKEEGAQARILLSEFTVQGAFVIDPQGQIIGFFPSSLKE